MVKHESVWAKVYSLTYSLEIGQLIAIKLQSTRGLECPVRKPGEIDHSYCAK